MNKKNQAISWIVCLSTFPPRQCGIATFTTDLTNAIDKMYGPLIKTKIIALNIAETNQFPYHDKVIFQINQNTKKDYINVANELNKLKEVKIINIQHEFGIFGGEYGSYLLLFLKKIKKPVVITFHTVLPKPNKKILTIVRQIAKYSKAIIVMTLSSKEILEKEYKIKEEKIIIIPHGIHNVSYKTSKQAKLEYGFSDKLILSSFGLLNPGKGIEYVLMALPKVIKKIPNVRFLIAGVTHPVILKQEGEAYRNFLIKKVNELKLNKNVFFYNTYFNIKKLLKFLEGTDVYLSTSLNPNQTVSGTLSYALGSGRPVISTSFSQAKQDITSDVGILVDFKNPKSFEDAIISLLENNQLREQMGKNAYFHTRHMIWENVALSYVKFFSKITPGLISKQRKFPPIKLDHLIKLTDNFGIIQFAKLDEPDISSGYTLDDNARALIVSLFCYERFKTKSSLKLISTYLNFIKTVSKKDGYFDNYVNSKRKIDKQRNIDESSEDSSSRALYALALVSVSREVPDELRKKAYNLFKQSTWKNITFSSPRAIAFYIKALCTVFLNKKNPTLLAVLRFNCEQLVSLYEKNYSKNWEWFEHYLTYSNATLIEALIFGYKATNEKRYLDIADKTLNFLIKHTFKKDIYNPIGQNGWFFKDKTRQYFDQQPEDVTATIETLNTMFKLTNNEYYKKLAVIAFNWFLGENALGHIVYDHTTGGCYDGIGEKFINLNQGAESTISYLLARFSLED